MKRLLLVLVLSNVGLLVGLCWNELVVHKATADEAACTSEQGDLNGDQMIDIGDAVHLVLHLFMSGPPPVPFCMPISPPCLLPATGQTKCYDDAGNEISCDRAEFPGQDALYQTGCSNESRFVDNGDGTVTDNCTRLMWQKDTADTSGNGSIGDEDRPNWQGALKYCEALDLAGHTDWRLPNVRELQSIVDYGRLNPSIDPVFQAMVEWYWSSSSDQGTPTQVWLVSFSAGYVTGIFVGRYDGNKGNPHFVRAVRNAE